MKLEAKLFDFIKYHVDSVQISETEIPNKKYNQ